MADDVTVLSFMFTAAGPAVMRRFVSGSVEYTRKTDSLRGGTLTEKWQAGIGEVPLALHFKRVAGKIFVPAAIFFKQRSRISSSVSPIVR